MELVERLNERINELEDQLSEIEEQKKRDEIVDRWLWTQHTETADAQTLPVPRLELVYTSNPGEYVCVYRMAYKHLLGQTVFVPLGQTKISGGLAPRPGDMPFRDGAHIINDAKQLKLPAYSVVGDDSVMIYDPLANKA